MKLSRSPRAYVIGGVELSREEIVHKYLHLVKYVAGRISVNLPPNVEINDFINDGILGLIDAIEKYDDARGVKFETYAITRINGAILDALRSLDWVPRAVRQRARELERTYQELEVELGRAPSEAEVGQRLGLSKKEFDQLIQRVRGTAVLSLEEFLPNEKGYEIPLVDTLRDDDNDVMSEVESREVHAELVRAVDESAAARAHGYHALLLRRANAQRDQGCVGRLRVAGLADPRPGGDSPAPAPARVAQRPRLSR